MIKFLKKKYKTFNAWMAYNSPGALSTRGWRLFKEEFKERAPIRYYFHNQFKCTFIYPIFWKYRDISQWIRYRTYDKYHILNTGLKPDYYGVETQILHVNFNMLKEFVEVEQAWQSYCWSNDYKKASWCEKYIPFYHVFYPFRDAERGVNHFAWASTLDDPSLPPMDRAEKQAEAAREILALYNWWVKDRPARKSIEIPSYDHQGLDLMASLDDDFDREAPDFKAHEKAMKENMDQEEEWQKEDTEMLVRLMRIRTSLWT